MNDNLAEVEVEEEVELDQEETEEVELGEDGEPIEKAEIEPWMQEDDEEQDSSRMVPEAAIIKAKQKLKGRLADQKAESDTEIDKLRAEIEALKAGKVATPQATPTARPKRPRSSDFDTDEAYEKAMDVYEDEVYELRSKRLEQTRTIQTTQQQAQADLKKAVDDHNSRRIKLQEKHGISDEVYDDAELVFRSAIESVRPGQGDQIADTIIQTIGDGSEKLIYHLKKNKAKRGEMISLLASDPSGLKAVAYLAQQNIKISNTTQRRSAAKKPASEVDGDIPPNAKAGALKRKYDAAHKKGGGQEAYNIKKEAKKMNVDTSSW